MVKLDAVKCFFELFWEKSVLLLDLETNVELAVSRARSERGEGGVRASWERFVNNFRSRIPVLLQFLHSLQTITSQIATEYISPKISGICKFV